MVQTAASTAVACHAQQCLAQAKHAEALLDPRHRTAVLVHTRHADVPGALGAWRSSLTQQRMSQRAACPRRPVWKLRQKLAGPPSGADWACVWGPPGREPWVAGGRGGAA